MEIRPLYYVPNDQGGMREATYAEWTTWSDLVKDDDETLYRAGGKLVGTGVVNGATVLTVFDGMNCETAAGAPTVFVTTITGGTRDGFMQRYSEIGKAEEGHVKALAYAGDTAPAPDAPYNPEEKTAGDHDAADESGDDEPKEGPHVENFGSTAEDRANDPNYPDGTTN